jgi:hypothetical protein
MSRTSQPIDNPFTSDTIIFQGSYILERFSIFLITLALPAGMVGCAPAQYELNISSTEGGTVTSPGDVTFIYYEREANKDYI